MSKPEAKDKLGGRLGTRAAMINACLSAKVPKTTKHLEQKSGKRAVRNHLDKMKKLGFLSKSKSGWLLIKVKGGMSLY